MKFLGKELFFNDKEVWHGGNFNPATKANVSSPALTGIPTAPTAKEGTSNKQIATTEFVQNAIEGSSSGGVFARKKQEFVATEGQRVFNITIGSYTPNAGRLNVYLWGQLQPETAYAQTSSTSFTLSAGVSAGVRILAEWIETVDIQGMYSGHGSSHALGSSDQITPAMIGASPIGHLHDDRYANIGHDHDEMYQPKGNYSPVNHEHNYDDKYQAKSSLIRNIHVSYNEPTNEDGQDGDLFLVLEQE